MTPPLLAILANFYTLYQGSLGIPKVSWLEKLPTFSQANKEYSFHDTTLSDIIDNAFHALALDEKRPPFSPAVWERPDNVKTVSPPL
jgi:Uncharacterized alpha/beta hydrolase domain (DUF2235)